MTLQLSEFAINDLVAGYWFYEHQEPGIGAYFRACLYADIESLKLYAGSHPMVAGYHRALARRFPYAIYYQLSDGRVIVMRVLDCRRKPGWIRRQLRRE